MNTNELKLALMDIDGTVVNEARELTPLAKKVLQHLHKKGIKLGIASGRTVNDIKHSTSEWDLGFDWDVIIGLNGGELFDLASNEFSSLYPLQPEHIKEAYDLYSSAFTFNPFIYLNEDLVCLHEDLQMKGSADHAGLNFRQADSLEEFWAQPIGKIMFRIQDPAMMKDMEEFTLKNPSPHFKAFKTQPTLLEVCDPRISKALPFEKIGSNLNIGLNNIAAFGDTSNDNEMLLKAGLGVCLLNGTDDTKACADEITPYDNDHDGWAKYMLEKFPELFADM